jgi:NAD(P)-dependent dehydrogenase (short-subunit alcohol dehydrogenase family)
LLDLQLIARVGRNHAVRVVGEEYKERGIAFNVLALGAVQTEMLEEAFPDTKRQLKANEMADYIFDFTLTGNKYFNGKVLQVSSTNPI